LEAIVRFRSALSFAAVCGLALTARSGAQGTAAPQRLDLTTPRGALSATLTMPAAAGRVPVAVLLAATNSGADQRASFAQKLVADGVASLRPDAVGAANAAASPDSAVRDVAGWITRLRNDPRFERIMVIAWDKALVIGARAGRAARADGIVVLGSPEANRAVLNEVAQPGTVDILLTQPEEYASITRFIRTITVPRHPEGERRSPRDVVIAEIAGARLSIEYGRPSKRGRAIWGALVPYTRWWMPGADEATSFTTSAPLVFGSVMIPANDYTVYTLPGEATFSLIINGETGQFHTTYHPDRDVAHIEMQRSAPSSPAEQVTFAIEPRGDGGVLKLAWDDREYAAAFLVKHP
jgi:hypothetical protein